MRPVFNRLLPLLVLPLAFAACEDSSFGPAGQAGTMSIMLTDAPGDFDHAIVTIASIELLGEDGNVMLREDPVTVDLLELQNEVMVLVGETPVPGGTYSELRLVITDGLIVVEQDDGSTLVYASSDAFAASEGFTADGDLQMPSFGQSGLKIKLPAGEAVVEGDDNAVLIDFNVAESFGHQAGNSGKWVLHPVVHATGFTTTGSLRLDVVIPDSVTLPIVDDTVQVTPGMLSAVLDRNGDLIPVLLTDDDEDGTWEATFLFLPPGDWTVDLGLPDGMVVTTDPALPLTFTVVSAQTATQTLTITSAGLAP
jgi:hypothetical protein